MTDRPTRPGFPGYDNHPGTRVVSPGHTVTDLSAWQPPAPPDGTPTPVPHPRVDTDPDGSLVVRVSWSLPDPSPVTLDRTDGHGWSVGGHRADRRATALAARLVTAISAGAVFPNPRVTYDLAGYTYVTSDGARVMGRRMNADLRRLGY